MGGIALLFFIVFLGLIWWTFTQSKKADEAWSGAGRLLQLAYSPGSLMQSRTLIGKLGSNRVRVDTVRHGGKNSTTYTRYRVSYPHPLRLGLRIEQEGFFDGFTKALGAQDIATGDAAFDQVALVKGHHANAVQRFLTAGRRSIIQQALFAHRGLEIGDEEICWECRGLARSQPQIVTTIRNLCHLADSIRNDSSNATGCLDPLSGSSSAGDRIPLPRAARVPPALPGHAMVKPALPEHRTVVPPPPPLHALEPATYQFTPPPEPPLVRAEPVRSAPPGLAKELVCSELFREGINSSDIEKIFAGRFAGRRVTWRGTLRDCQFTSFDFVFGGQPCTKLTLDLVTLDGDSLGARAVRAVAQLPPDARDSLVASIGTEQTVCGELIKVDRLLRVLFLKDATLV